MNHLSLKGARPGAGIFGVAVLLMVTLGSGPERSGIAEASCPRHEMTAKISGLPASFVQNDGQWDPEVRFLVRKPGMVGRLEANALAFKFRASRSQGIAVRMAFEGADPQVVLQGLGRQEGALNYLAGKPSGSRVGVPAYDEVLYKGLYPGVDLKVRSGEEGRLEYDLLLAPGADLEQVTVDCQGIEDLRIAPDGVLVMKTALGEIRQNLPSTWTETPAGHRQSVQARYIRLDEHRFGFRAPGRDKDLALVIDPPVEFATYVGGSAADENEWIRDVKVDSAGRIFACGETESANFPVTPGAYDTSYNGTDAFGGGDAFVLCLSADGSRLVFSTFLGGQYGPEDGATESARRIALLPNGNIAVAGFHDSAIFPTTAGAYRGGLASGTFVSVLSPAGNALVYSTATMPGELEDMTADPATGDILIVGGTSSRGLATAGVFGPALHAEFGGGFDHDAFVARLRPAGQGAADLRFFTYLGGSWYDYAMAIALDPAGNILVGGATTAVVAPSPDNDFPVTAGAYGTQMSVSPDWDYNRSQRPTHGFISVLSFDATALLYSTYLQGNEYDYVTGVSAYPTGGILFSGITTSTDLPATAGAIATIHSGITDVFLGLLTPAGNDLAFLTYLGGTGRDGSQYSNAPGDHLRMAVSPSGAITLAGFASAGFPMAGLPYDATYDTGDNFVARITAQPDPGRPNGYRPTLAYSSYVPMGGDAQWPGQVLALALRNDGAAILAGKAGSTGFPVTAGAYDASYNGGLFDAAIASLDIPATRAHLDLIPPVNRTYRAGDIISYSETITNATASPITVDLFTEGYLPNGSAYNGNPVGLRTVTVNPGAPFTRTVNLRIPPTLRATGIFTISVKARTTSPFPEVDSLNFEIQVIR